MEKKTSIILQGSFPGGRPHASVIMLAKSAQLANASKSTNNPVTNNVPKNSSPAKQNMNRGNTGIIQNNSINRNNNAYQVDSARLNLRSNGSPLPSEVKQKMEGVFKTDLSGIRIHLGPQAESIGALAFTTGNDIYFANGQYNPYTPYGQRILGHELTHVVQQRSGRVRNPFGNGMAVVNDPGMEAEADRMGLHAASVSAENVKTIQRKNNLSIIPVNSSNPDSRVLSVLVDGKNAGSVEIRNGGGDATRLVNLKVSEEFRGAGAGTALVDAARKATRQMGKNKVTLESEDNGSGKLNSWYQKQGFIRIGTDEHGYAKMVSPA
jgi:ribosomal protein S18 acetylase RimI-like enzyme